MIVTNDDGSLSYEYNLTINPCPKCGATNIVLFENGGRKITTGGARCNNDTCDFEIIENNIPGVPSMSMLLDIWNDYVDKYNAAVWKEKALLLKMSGRGIF